MTDGEHVAIAKLIDGSTLTGKLTTEHAASSYGRPVFVSDDGQALDWAMIAGVIDRGQLIEAIAETYQKWFIDRTTSAGVAWIVYDSATGRAYGSPSVLPLGDDEQLITKLTDGCFGQPVENPNDIVYLLTEIAPEWVDDMLNASDWGQG